MKPPMLVVMPSQNQQNLPQEKQQVMRIKEYFTDGLLQIAIVLSLLRTDLDSYLGSISSRFRSRPELQEIFLGSLSGYTQTDVYAYNRWNSRLGGYVHSKSIDSLHIDDVFRDLHSLSYYRRFDGIETNINTWLVSGSGSGCTEPHPAVGTPQNGEGNSAADTNTPLAEDEHAAVENTDFPCNFGSDLTKEDMDLIEVLWRQDMDIGVTRDEYDSALRQELEKESLQELKDKQKVEESTQNETESDGLLGFPQLDLSGNYMIDGETGELIQVNNSPPLVNDNFNVFQSLPGEMPSTPQIPQDSFPNSYDIRISDQSIYGLPEDPPHFVASGNQDFYGSGISQNQNFLENPLANFPMVNTITQISRQDSTEERWQDFFGLLNSSAEADSIYDANNTGINNNVMRNLVNNVSMAAPNINIFNLSQERMAQYPNESDYLTPSTSAFSTFLNNTINETSYFPTYLPAENDTFSTLALQNDTFSFPDQSNLNVSLPSAANLSLPDFSELAASFETNETLLQQLLERDLIDNASFDDIGIDLDNASNSDLINAEIDWSSDSAVSSMTSPMQWSDDVGYAVSLPLDGANGNSVPKEEFKNCDGAYDQYRDPESFVGFDLQPSSLYPNSTTASNGTDRRRQPKAVLKNVHHNHSYPLQPGQMSREEKEAITKREKEEKAIRCRDEKRAKEMKIPFNLDDIIDMPVDQFSEMLSEYKLTESQLQLIRDIRRRGKNKQAAQNCRKRKLDVIQTLEEEVEGLRNERDQLEQKRHQMKRETSQLKEKFNRLHTEIFQSLRDERGRPYNAEEFTLQQTADGELFLVPKNTSASYSAAAEQTHDEKNSRKRKPKRKD